MAKKLRLHANQVKIWFQNKRSKFKKNGKYGSSSNSLDNSKTSSKSLSNKIQSNKKGKTNDPTKHLTDFKNDQMNSKQSVQNGEFYDDVDQDESSFDSSLCSDDDSQSSIELEDEETKKASKFNAQQSYSTENNNYAKANLHHLENIQRQQQHDTIYHNLLNERSQLNHYNQSLTAAIAPITPSTSTSSSSPNSAADSLNSRMALNNDKLILSSMLQQKPIDMNGFIYSNNIAQEIASSAVNNFQNNFLPNMSDISCHNNLSPNGMAYSGTNSFHFNTNNLPKNPLNSNSWMFSSHSHPNSFPVQYNHPMLLP